MNPAACVRLAIREHARRAASLRARIERQLYTALVLSAALAVVDSLAGALTRIPA